MLSIKAKEITKTNERKRENKTLKGVLPKTYARQEINKQVLGELVDLFSFNLGSKEAKAQDILGRVYEYFLGKFASAEGKLGGEFYTPSCVVRTLVEMIEPYEGQIFERIMQRLIQFNDCRRSLPIAG